MRATIKPNGITNYFKEHNRQLIELFAGFQKFKAKDFFRARELFTAFKFAYQRHVVWEEEIVYPVFEQKTAHVYTHAVYILTQEHRELSEKIDQINRKLLRFETDTELLEKGLIEQLKAHQKREEESLYPAVDTGLEKEERESVFAALKNIPDERYISNQPTV